jgi:hypothetical protein
MGHSGGRRHRGIGNSPMDRVYPETTPPMLARMTSALDERIANAQQVTGDVLNAKPDRDWRCPSTGGAIYYLTDSDDLPHSSLGRKV